jgi:hypothetical protein
LYFLGCLSQDEYDLLRAALKQRNPIAHGYSSPHQLGAVTGKLIDATGSFLKVEAGSLAS